MTRLLAMAMLVLGVGLPCAVVPGTSRADPVVVELFTSQGCSSCPPADALFSDIARRDDVIAMALHVDYWDYIGWKDVFASPVYTRRQRAYAHAAQRNMVYTPQMIVDGVVEIAGARPERLDAAIQQAAATPPRAKLTLRRDGEKLIVTVAPSARVEGPARVVLVRFRPDGTVDITHGENAGRTMNHVNVVGLWQEIGTWPGKAPMRIETEYGGAAKGAVLVQAEGPGAVLAAARVP